MSERGTGSVEQSAPGVWSGSVDMLDPRRSSSADRRPTVYHPGKLPRDLPAWFTELDTDQDAQVGLYEWKASTRSFDEFDKVDRNGDGFLTVEETLRSMAQAKDRPGSESTRPGERGSFLGGPGMASTWGDRGGFGPGGPNSGGDFRGRGGFSPGGPTGPGEYRGGFGRERFGSSPSFEERGSRGRSGWEGPRGGWGPSGPGSDSRDRIRRDR
jgi:hypothetical protein